MGLDLILYTAKKMHDDNSEIELAYGRKTWAIASFFMNKCESNEDECYYDIPEYVWDEFIEKINPYFSNTNFCKLIDEYNPYTEESANEEIEELIEFFLDRALDDAGPYTLGAPWEAKALLRWYEADKEVRKVYEKEEPVFLCVSY